MRRSRRPAYRSCSSTLRGLASSRPASGSTAAVDRDRQVERDLVPRRQFLLQAAQDERGPGRLLQQSRLDRLQRRKLRQLGLERPREAAVAEIPAVELLQEPG